MKEAFIISPSAHGAEPTFRNAHFLKSIAATSTHQLTFNPSSSPVFIPEGWPFKINFIGWCYPHSKWVNWVAQLKPKFESVWKKVGIFESIEQYLPHRVAMQFGMDQDVSGYVSRFNETNAIAWESYCRPFSDTCLYYFSSRFFKAGVTTCYAKWWKKPVLGPQSFVKNDVPQNRIASSSKYRPHAHIPKLVCSGTVTSGKSSDDGSKTSKGDNIVDDDVPSDFVPKLVGCTINIGKFSDPDGKNIVDDADGGNIVDDDVPSVQDRMKVGGNMDADGGILLMMLILLVQFLNY